MFSLRKIKEYLSDKLCRMVEFRLYVNNELRASAFKITPNVFSCKHDGRHYLVHLEHYHQETIDEWLKDHFCNPTEDHVMIYKKRHTFLHK